MDAKEFKQKYMPHYKLLYRVAYSLVHNEQDAEDLLQDLYLKLWRKREMLPADSQTPAYLITMMRHIHYDQQKLKHLDTSAELSDCIGQVEVKSAGTLVEDKDEAEHLTRLIDQLPEKERKVIQLHAVEGHSYDEMEHETGLSQSNLRVIVMRTRNKLKEQFTKLTDTWKK